MTRWARSAPGAPPSGSSCGLADVVVEQRADDALDLRVLAARRLAEVDVVEHERAQRVHRAARLVALHDVAGLLGVLDEVVHEAVDAQRAGRRRARDRVRRQVLARAARRRAARRRCRG